MSLVQKKTGTATIEPVPPALENGSLLDILSEQYSTQTGRAGAVDATGGQALSGHLAGVDGEGRILFLPEGAEEAIPAALAVPLSDDEVVRAARSGQRALALRTTGPRPRLVLVGILRERVSEEARDNLAGIKVRVDGDTLRMSAETQIEFVCGKSRILLRRNGRIEISGSYLLSRSRGPIKIKGATVEIN